MKHKLKTSFAPRCRRHPAKIFSQSSEQKWFQLVVDTGGKKAVQVQTDKNTSRLVVVAAVILKYKKGKDKTVSFYLKKEKEQHAIILLKKKTTEIIPNGIVLS